MHITIAKMVIGTESRHTSSSRLFQKRSFLGERASAAKGGFEPTLPIFCAAASVCLL
jgi:hypothetical protein